MRRTLWVCAVLVLILTIAVWLISNNRDNEPQSIGLRRFRRVYKHRDLHVEVSPYLRSLLRPLPGRLSAPILRQSGRYFTSTQPLGKSRLRISSHEANLSCGVALLQKVQMFET